jgi:hypothetical protein
VSIELLANEGEALAVAWRLQRTGNFVAAFDTAQEGLNRWAGSLPLQHVGILALASCGSTRAALAAYRTSGLGDSDVEDFLALEARLLKDLAFQAGGVGEGSLLVQAAEAYERIVERTRGSYPAQNAAFLWALAGYESRAMRLATTVAHDLARLDVPADPEAAYFYWATVAEAALVLGHKSALSAAVDAANQLCRRNLWARTRTFSQMRRLLPLRSDCRDIILRWHVPAMGFVLPSNEPFSTAHDMELVEGEDAAVLVYEASSGRVTQQELADFGSELHVIMPNAPVDDASPEPINLVLNRQTSGQRAGYTWSSLLLDESRDNEHWCAEVALGLSLGLAEALHAPWRVLREVRGRWCQYRLRRCRGLLDAECAADPALLEQTLAADRGLGSAPACRRHDLPQDLGGRGAWRIHVGDGCGPGRTRDDLGNDGTRRRFCRGEATRVSHGFALWRRGPGAGSDRR